MTRNKDRRGPQAQVRHRLRRRLLIRLQVLPARPDENMAAHVHPSLTTVRQDLARGAGLLVDLLLRRIAGERTESVILPAELVVRESSGDAP